MFITVNRALQSGGYREKKSIFYAHLFPVAVEAAINKELQFLRKEHPKANHFCYSWRLGYGSEVLSRSNDDGEPKNSAGKPILKRIEGRNLTQVLLVVVRYFGGIKLGTGGLARAYGRSAEQVVEIAEPYFTDIKNYYIIVCEYEQLHYVLRKLQKLGIEIIEQKIGTNCHLEIGLSIMNEVDLIRRIKKIKSVNILSIKN